MPALPPPHWEQTRRALRPHPLVLIRHDTTALDVASHQAWQGAGPIGAGHGQGCWQPNRRAVRPEPRPVLGRAYPPGHVRRPAPPAESAARRQQRQRESPLGREGIRAAGAAPAGCGGGDGGDRGRARSEAMGAARAVAHHFRFRRTPNRAVFTAAGGPALVYRLA